MSTKTRLIVKRQLKERTIIVNYCDDKICNYTVTDYFESNMVEEPKFFDLKRYYGYMVMVIGNSIILYFTTDKLFILLHTGAIFLALFFWIISHSERQMKFEEGTMFQNL